MFWTIHRVALAVTAFYVFGLVFPCGILFFLRETRIAWTWLGTIVSSTIVGFWAYLLTGAILTENRRQRLKEEAKKEVD